MKNYKSLNKLALCMFKTYNLLPYTLIRIKKKNLLMILRYYYSDLL